MRKTVCLAIWVMFLAACLDSGDGSGYSGEFDAPGAQADEPSGFIEDDYGIDCPILEGCIPSEEEFSLAAFISGHHYQFPAPASDQIITVHALTSFVAQPKLGAPKALLLIGLNTARITEQTAVPLDLMAVVDKSGSMDGTKIWAVREALRTMAASLQPEDRFGIVTYDSSASVRLPLTGASESASINSAIDTILAGGATNIYDGLTLGYNSFGTDATRTRWTVLLSDGLPTAGVTTHDLILDWVRSWRDLGIGTSSVGVGADANSDLMAAVGPAGGGVYYFLDEPAALGDVFQKEVRRVTRPMADNVQFSFSLTDRYDFAGLYGFEVDAAQTFSIPRVFYEEKSAGFIAALDFVPGQDNAAEWGDLTVHYSPVGSTEVTSQTVTFGLPFDPASSPQQEYHNHASSQKAYAVLTAGLAIQEAGGMVWEYNNLQAADGHLTNAIQEFDRQTASLSGDAELAFTRSLLVGLQTNIRDYLARIANGGAPPLHLLQAAKAAVVTDPNL